MNLVDSSSSVSMKVKVEFKKGYYLIELGALPLKGALVFLGAFVIFLILTLGYPALPPGPQIYGLLNVPSTDYPVLGIPVTTLAIAIFNGVVYGIIAWLTYTVADMFTKKSEPEESEHLSIPGGKPYH